MKPLLAASARAGHEWAGSRKTRRQMKATPETMRLADEATRAFPRSPKLWCLRGYLIQGALNSCPHNLSEALASYQKAIEADPSFADAWEAAGDFYRDILHDEPAAQTYFREAERLEHPGEPGSARDILRREFYAEEGSFLIQA